MTVSPLQPERLTTLDVARGLAALAVAILHWSHFFLVDGASTTPTERFPFYPYLSLFYEHGHSGVDFFFILSGVIFFTKYRTSIADRATTPWWFFVCRFSRLYPLHFATLMFVALLQVALLKTLGHYYAIYPIVDGPHFLANLLFVQHWGFMPLLQDFSFNAPAWSLSIECLLYIVFFIMARYMPVWTMAPIIAFGAILMIINLNFSVGRGLFCFFSGGTLVLLYPHLTNPFRAVQLHSVTVLLLAMVFFGWYFKSSGELFYIRQIFLISLVGSLLLLDHTLTPVLSRLSWLGDISYSLYMIHFPLQLLVILGMVLATGTFSPDPFLSPWVFLTFYGSLIVLSIGSYRLFEKPIQRAIRNFGTTRRRAATGFETERHQTARQRGGKRRQSSSHHCPENQESPERESPLPEIHQNAVRIVRTPRPKKRCIPPSGSHKSVASPER